MEFFRSLARRVNPTVLYFAGALLVLSGAFAIGYYAGTGNHSQIDKVTTLENKEAGKSDRVDFSSFWTAWNILNDKFVSTKSATTTDQERVYGAIKGLAQSLGDPYTEFFPPVEAKSFQDQISGNFEGVGMEVGMRDNVVTVISPLKGTPAEQAGIKAGDKILQINGTSTQNMTIDEAIGFIRGPQGSKVNLTLYREGVKTPIIVSVTRDVIDVPTVESQNLKDKGVFVISIYDFSANSPALFRNALKTFASSGQNKLIIDLRGNPGGYLEAAVDMASWFLPEGKTVVSEDSEGKGENQTYRSKGYDIFNHDILKTVVLIDGGSASASEILAGALAEHGIAKLVGTNTFGKGSVQELIPVTSNTSLKVTVARWLTPLGNSISNGGLKPHYEVKVTQEDIDADRDPQLDKAIEVLNSQ